MPGRSGLKGNTVSWEFLAVVLLWINNVFLVCFILVRLDFDQNRTPFFGLSYLFDGFLYIERSNYVTRQSIDLAAVEGPCAKLNLVI